MPRINSINPIFVETIDNELEEGMLYISEKYGVAIHPCACGCKVKTVTPLGKGGWILSKSGDRVSLIPSIGNWSGEKPDYHAHYFITDNQIKWC